MPREPNQELRLGRMLIGMPQGLDYLRGVLTRELQRGRAKPADYLRGMENLACLEGQLANAAPWN